MIGHAFAWLPVTFLHGTLDVGSNQDIEEQTLVGGVFGKLP
jgi:hypothetical protein